MEQIYEKIQFNLQIILKNIFNLIKNLIKNVISDYNVDNNVDNNNSCMYNLYKTIIKLSELLEPFMSTIANDIQSKYKILKHDEYGNLYYQRKNL